MSLRHIVSKHGRSIVGRIGNFHSAQSHSANVTFHKQRRHLASDSSNFIRVEEDKDLCTVYLNRPPVNSLNLALVKELTNTIRRLEKNENCKGIILTSDVPKIFSGGIDLTEMHPFNAEKYAKFWRAFQELWINLYGTRLATVAAINGHSPAGGCLLSMSCDYRVMASGLYRIGLNESLIGIMVPFWFQDVMSRTVGLRETERALQLGHMYPVQEALQVGLVDQVVDEVTLLNNAKKALHKFLKVDDNARYETKISMRRPAIEKLLSCREDDIGVVVRFLSRDAIQQGIGRYLESLKFRPS